MKFFITLFLILAFASNAFALTLKVKVLTDLQEEIFVSVNNFKKITQGHEVVFDVDKGFVYIEVMDKKITKFINKDSFLVVKLKSKQMEK